MVLDRVGRPVGSVCAYCLERQSFGIDISHCIFSPDGNTGYMYFRQDFLCRDDKENLEIYQALVIFAA